MDSTVHLDLERLEKVRHLPGKITARCPACAEEGRDRTGNNLVLYPDGPFWCVAAPDHTKRIWHLPGHRRPLAAKERERHRAEFIRRKREEREQERRRRAAQCAVPELVRRWQWGLADVRGDSPLDPKEGDCPRTFLRSLFQAESIVWTGHVYESGDCRYAGRWKVVWEWDHKSTERIGPMVTPSTWKPGTVSRKSEHVATAPYIILDFDGPRGWKPRNQADLDRHLAESLAIVRWLREDRRWKLAAIIHTGNKSLHAWFEYPGDPIVSSLRESFSILGIGSSLIGAPEHPARLPGQVHSTTGLTSRVLWIRRDP